MSTSSQANPNSPAASAEANKSQNDVNNDQVSLIALNNRPRKSSSLESCRAPSLTREDKIKWLRRHMPVISQPVCDINNGYGLIGVFVNFEEVKDLELSQGPYRVHLKIMYQGEASYDRRPAHKQETNGFGTYLYRSFNFYMFRRTVDIDQLCFEGVSVVPKQQQQQHGSDDHNNNDIDEKQPQQHGGADESAWTSLSTEDYNGEQIWNHGVKGDFCFCYSLNYHYDLDAPFTAWDKFQNTYRPVLHVNTNNHLHGPEDRNPDLEKHLWVNYPVWEGDAQDAELFGRTLAVHKANLFSCFRNLSWCCCLQKLKPDNVHSDYFVELPVFDVPTTKFGTFQLPPMV